jgi:putative oxidoreductase
MTFLDRLAPQIHGILRIVTALLFLEHGTGKLFNFPPLGMDMEKLPPLILAAAAIEIVGGALITLGFYGRIAAFICSGEMAVAYFMSHHPKNIFPVINGGDAAILFCFVFLFIAAAGPGAFAINKK